MCRYANVLMCRCVDMNDDDDVRVGVRVGNGEWGNRMRIWVRGEGDGLG